MKVNKLKLILCNIYILIIITLFYALIITNELNIIKIITLTSITNFFSFTLFYYILHKKILTTSFLFIVFSYLFHFGQTILFFLDSKYSISILDVRNFINETVYINSSIFSFIVISIISLSILLFTKKNQIVEKNIGGEKERIKYNKIAYIVLLFTMPVSLYLNLTQLSLSTKLGYSAIFNSQNSGVLSFFSSLRIVGFMLLVITAKSKRSSIFACSFFCIYNAIFMLSGSRGYAIVEIIFIIYSLLMVLDNFNLKKFILIIVIGYVGLTGLNVIQKTRADGITMKSISENINYSSFKEPIYETLEEFGGTLASVELIYSKIPKYIEYGKGNTYLYSFIGVLPNVRGMFTEYIEKSYFLNGINNMYLGGSYIGELYYNFGYFSLFIAVIIGAFVEKISQKIEYSFYYKNYFNLCILSLLVINILLWVRGYFGALVRNFIWPLLIFIVVDYFQKRIHFNTLRKQK